MSGMTDQNADPVKTSTEPSTETEQTPTPTTPEESATRIASALSTGTRVVGKYRNVGAVRGRIQA